MLKLIAVIAAVGFSGAAFAKADCTAHPKDEWMKESDARAQLDRVVRLSLTDVFAVDRNGPLSHRHHDYRSWRGLSRSVRRFGFTTGNK